MGNKPANLTLRSTAKGIEFCVHVSPGASRNAIAGIHNGALSVKVTSQPEKGRANKAVISLLSKNLGVRKSGIIIVRGHTSRDKTVAVAGVTATYISEKLAAPANK